MYKITYLNKMSFTEISEAEKNERQTTIGHGSDSFTIIQVEY